MNDIMKAILEGAMKQQAAQQRRAAPQQADPIADLIRGIAGGQAPAPRQRPQQQQGIGIEDLIGGILGGSQRHDTRQPSGIADMLEMVMGGGRGRNSAANPIANALAEKLGIPPFLAQAAVAYFMSKMLQRASGGGSQRMPQQQAPSGNPLEDIFGIGRAKPDSQTVDLDDMLDMMGDDNKLDSHIGGQGGMAEELAEQTGMPKGTALDAIKQIVKIVGGNRQQVKPSNPRPQQMEDLLDTW